MSVLYGEALGAIKSYNERSAINETSGRALARCLIFVIVLTTMSAMYDECVRVKPRLYEASGQWSC